METLVKNNEKFENRREAFLAMTEIDSTPEKNVFWWAGNLMRSLKFGTISSADYDGLCEELRDYCRTEGIETSIAGISLF